MTWLGQLITLNIRQQVYEHLQRLGLRYYDEQQHGQIMSRVTHDTGNLQDFLTEGLQDLLRDILTCVLIGGILFSLNSQLALLTLIPVPLLAVGSIYFGKMVHHVFHQRWRKFGALNALLGDTIPGVRVVKAFAQELREISKFKEINLDLIRVLLLATRISQVVFPIMGFLTTIGSVIVWGVGGYWVMRGEHGLTLGALVAFTAYLWRFYGPIQNLSRMNQRIQWTATAAERVFEVLDQKPEVEDAPEAYELPEIQGRVTFEDVTFSYDGERDVLKNVSFEVEPGEMIGLVGPSGAGKTTLINLLCRFYDIKSGAIRIDGHDLRDVTQTSLRRQIGIVLQEPYLFHGSIAENIAYGRPDATLAEIIAAARAANAHDFICKMPDGYDTLLGERGLRLSGGERQRLSIARAILKNPRLLIFDEATSSVDTETEADIREAIDRLVQGRTTFSIAHRFSTLRNANRLIVLNEGNFVEMGTHEELLRKEDGLFARLCRMQQEMSQIVAWQE
jgi:ATP-binding cassette subfamily B protein